METKEMKIIPPEGYEVDRENSTFEYIKFKPKSLTYEDVAKELFKSKFYFINIDDSIRSTTNIIDGVAIKPCNATSKKQLEKLLAINKLMNVAKYLNGDWKPDWSDRYEGKWCIYIDNSINNSIDILYCREYCAAVTYFKTDDLAQQAIEILGRETIRLALSTDW